LGAPLVRLSTWPCPGSIFKSLASSLIHPVAGRGLRGALAFDLLPKRALSE
jgi:hypothetical protein